MILNQKFIDDVNIYTVSQTATKDKIESLKNTLTDPSDIWLYITTNTDIYTPDGNLLCKFRKAKVPKPLTEQFYKNTKFFIVKKTNNRGDISGSKTKNQYTNPRICSNIIGFFDNVSSKQKYIIKQQNLKLESPIRPTRFNMRFPVNYENTLPYFREIDSLYSQIVPEEYNKQNALTSETLFRIGNTAFTTATVNINLQTTIHTDTGNYGFACLTVIENGEYKGGETCFPQYGVAVNVREGDILIFNGKEYHGNLAINGSGKRISVISYLRYNIWEKTHNKDINFFNSQNQFFDNLKLVR